MEKTPPTQSAKEPSPTRVDEVVKQLVFEEHWLSRFSSYLWYWGIESMGEGRGSRDKWKQEGGTYNYYEGLYVRGLSILYY